MEGSERVVEEMGGKMSEEITDPLKKDFLLSRRKIRMEFEKEEIEREERAEKNQG